MIIKNGFRYTVFFILLIAVFLRFYSYDNRWALAYDQARDLIVARYALFNFKIPLIGSFSSAGPFQWGPELYWILMASTLVFPFFIITPWVILSLLYVFSVFMVIRIGEKLLDKKFALIAGLLTAVSTAQIDQSTNLTNPSFVPIFAILAIWSMVSYIQSKKKIHFLFLLALFISITVSLHMQGVGLIFLLVFTIVGTKSFKFKQLGVVVLGLVIPFIPLFISDVQHGFFNFRNIIQYYLHDQYKVSFEVLGRRWLTYLGKFIPEFWGYIIGGHLVIGYIMPVLFIFTAILMTVKRKISLPLVILMLTFLCDIFIIKNTRSPLFFGYLTFLHPLAILLSTWVIYVLINQLKFIGVILLILIVGLTILADYKLISGSTNLTKTNVEKITVILEDKYPGRKYSIYEFNTQSNNLTYPLLLFLWHENKIDKNGYKIGIGADESVFSSYPNIENDAGINVSDLTASNESELKKAGWENIHPEGVYNSIQNWH